MVKKKAKPRALLTNGVATCNPREEKGGWCRAGVAGWRISLSRCVCIAEGFKIGKGAGALNERSPPLLKLKWKTSGAALTEEK